jgi:DNA-binding NarL/FixJ family response regulator
VIRVLVADDEVLVRAGIALVLSQEPDMEVVGEAGDGRSAVQAVLALEPDVALLDVRMPGLDGVTATRRIRAAGGTARVVILTSHDVDDYLLGALRAGADGFLLKDARPQDLVDGVRAVAAGGGLLAPSATRRLLARLRGGRPASDPRLDRLTDREREVLAALARGWSNAEIAEHLVLTRTAVKGHVSRVLAKLGLRDRVQAVVLAHEAGLADRDPTNPR